MDDDGGLQAVKQIRAQHKVKGQIGDDGQGDDEAGGTSGDVEVTTPTEGGTGCETGGGGEETEDARGGREERVRDTGTFAGTGRGYDG